MSDVVWLTLDPEEVADALQLTVEEIYAVFQDGRAVAPYAALWVQRRIGCQRSVHVMTDRVSFQRSKRQGTQRRCTRAELIADLRQSDPIVVVDIITDFPSIRMIQVSRMELIAAVEKGILGVSGIARRKFYRTFLDEEIGC